MRIGLDPNRWKGPPRQKTWTDRYLSCLCWVMVGGFFLAVGILLLWIAWNWLMEKL